MLNYNQKAKRKISYWLKKHPHIEEYIVNDLLFIYFAVLIIILLYAVIQL